MESLRTLVVTPRRNVTPGETIRVEFAFSNLGGATATSVRVRFAVPSGVSHVEGSDTLDDAPLQNERLDSIEGASLGDLAPNAQRRVACSFRVNDRVEDASELLFQAALATDQTAVVASNHERLAVRSRPLLQNTSTLVTLTAPEDLRPGSVVTVRATVANTGASSAHDVRVFLPLPPHTQYVARTARIAGRVLLNVEDEPFDYAAAAVVAEQLAPGQSVIVEYQAAIDSPLSDGTRIRVFGAVSSREIGEFALQSSELIVFSPPDFSNDETTLTVFCDDIVSPGTRVPMVVRVLNDGTGDAQNVSVTFDLPPGLAYTPGSAHLDGQPVNDEGFAGATFSFGTVPSGRVADVGISAIVTQSQTDLPIVATLQWKGGLRRFSRTLQVRVSSRFTRARNFIEADRGVVAAREDVTFTVHVFNDGTAPESDARLRIIPGAFLETVRVAESADEPIPYDEPFALGIVQPHAERTFVVQTSVASPVPDRSHLSLSAVLEFASGSYDLGNATVIVRSRPQVPVQSCTWERDERDPIRPGNTHEVLIRFTNEGADTLRDARMDLVLPAELALDRAQNARREGTESLSFGDIPAETTHEARIALRLVRPPKRDRLLVVEGTLYGKGISPVQFARLEIPTFAQPQFAPDAQLRSNPSESVNAGERVAYELLLRNSGDGPADYLSLRAVPSNLAVYIPGSTALNGMMIPDDLGASHLWSQRGLQLTDVNPGIELRVRWEMLVISPLAAGTAIETRLVAEWDERQSVALAAPPLIVESAPALAAGTAGTPISLAQLGAPFETPPAEAIVPLKEADLVAPPPPAPGPVAIEEPAIEAQPEPPSAARTEAPATRGPVLYVDFIEDELGQTLRALEKNTAGGLIPHILAIRALFPNAMAGARSELAQNVENAAVAMRAPLDRFFVRLSVPGVAITAKDLEDRESRFALRGLTDALLQAPSEPLPQRRTGIVRLSGSVNLDVLRARREELERSPLGSVAPWIVNASLLGSRIEYGSSGRSEVLGQYRDALIKVFSVLETLPMPEFHRVLSTSVNRTLDDALSVVLDAMRAAAHLAVSE